jgi:hypothetical protein
MERLENDLNAVFKQDEEIMEVIGHEPANLEQLDEQKTFLAAHLGERQAFIVETIGTIFDYLDVLLDNQYEIGFSLFDKSWQAYGLPKRLYLAKLHCDRVIMRCSKVFAEELVKSQIAVIKEIDSVQDELQLLKKENDITKVEDMSFAYGILKKRIETASGEAKLINFREGLVGAKHTDLRILEQIKKDFNPYCKLWFFIRDFERHHPRWMRGPLGELDRDAITEEINVYATELSRMERTQMKDQPAGLELVRALMAKVTISSPICLSFAT